MQKIVYFDDRFGLDSSILQKERLEVGKRLVDTVSARMLLVRGLAIIFLLNSNFHNISVKLRKRCYKKYKRDRLLPF